MPPFQYLLLSSYVYSIILILNSFLGVKRWNATIASSAAPYSCVLFIIKLFFRRDKMECHHCKFCCSLLMCATNTTQGKYLLLLILPFLFNLKYLAFPEFTLFFHFFLFRKGRLFYLFFWENIMIGNMQPSKVITF